MLVTGVVGQIKAAALYGNVGQLLFSPPAFQLLVFGQDGCLMLALLVVGKFQKNEAQHGGGVFAGF